MIEIKKLYHILDKMLVSMKLVIFVGMVIGGFLIIPLPTDAEGQTFVVTLTSDNEHEIGSLRWAVVQSNITEGHDKIDFHSSLSGQVLSLTAPLNITDDLSIEGLGAGIITLDGTYFQDSIIKIGDPTSNEGIHVTIKGITIQNGNNPNGFGGGIFVERFGSLHIEESEIRNNIASSGAGIYFKPDYYGDLQSNSTISHCVISNNKAVNKLIGSSKYYGSGAGIYFGKKSSPLLIKNTTISENEAEQDGGGISTTGQIEMKNVTLSQNYADTDNDSLGDGGGIYCGIQSICDDAPTKPIILKNTIIAENFKGTGNTRIPKDITGQAVDINSSSNNLIGTGGTGGLQNDNGNQINVAEPKLAELETYINYGRTTKVHALLPGSPAIDKGNNFEDMDSEDQRFEPRVHNGVVDIGAFESNFPPTAVDDSYETNENTVLTVPQKGVLINDIDDSGWIPWTNITVITTPLNGTVILNWDGSFTYEPSKDYVGIDTFTYKWNDGKNDSNIATVTINVKALNKAPVLNRSTSDLGGTSEDSISNAIAVSSFIDSTDADSNASKGIAITSTTGSSIWEYSVDGDSWFAIGSVSNNNALLLSDTSLIRYVPNNVSGETATITYRAWDQTNGTATTKSNVSSNGGSTAFSETTSTASLIVTNVNDSPIISSGPFTLNEVAKNSASTIVDVSEIATISDADLSPQTGITVVNSLGNGIWEYSLDGTNWLAFGAVSDTSSLLLPSTTKIRYQSSNLVETASFTFRGWDQTTGTSGSIADTTTNGGLTAFSTNTQTASIRVKKSNEANIITFSFDELLEPVTATISDGAIHVEVASTVDISNLKATYTASDSVQAVRVGEVEQKSGQTANNFNNSVTYIVTAEDGTTKNWVVTVNRPPTNIELSNNKIDEKMPIGTEVGLLSGTDSDTNEALTFAIQSGDTNAFAIDRNRLITNAELDFLNKNTYDLILRVTDKYGAYYDKAFTIELLDKSGPTAQVTMTSSNSSYPSKAKVGDIIFLDILVNEEIAPLTITIAGHNVIANDKGDNNPKTWNAAYVMQETDNEVTIPFTIDFQDLKGNNGSQITAVTTGQAVIFDKTIPTASTVTISSTNIDSTKAKVGDTIKLLFTASEHIIQPAVTIIGKTATVTNNGDQTSWQAEYTIQSDDLGGTIASFTIDYEDLAGNKGAQVSKTTNPSSVTVISSNANLSSLTLNNGILDPVFDANETSYSVNVGNGVANIIVTPTVADPNGLLINLNNTPIISGASVNVPLAIGPNTIEIEVTAQGHTTKTYTITITRLLSTNAELTDLQISEGTLSPVFDSAVTSYSVNVDPTISELTITAAPKQANTSVTIDGEITTSDTIRLNFGSTHVPIVVTAEDGVTTQTYNVTINRIKSRNANLNSLDVDKGALTPSFSPSVDTYVVNIDHQTSQIAVSAQVEDPSSSLTMNGKNVSPTISSSSISFTTGDALAIATSGDTIQISMTETFDLQVGSNLIPVTVTAQDGGTKIYMITAIRSAAPNRNDDDDDDNDNGRGGSVPTTQTPSLATEKETRTVNVELGEGATPIALISITRETKEDGKQIDNVVLNEKTAKSIVEKALQENHSTARIVIDDLQDNPADEVTVSVPLESINQLVGGDISLELQTNGVKLSIPQETLKSLQQLGAEVYFNIVPIIDENGRKEVEQRTIEAAEVREIAEGNQVIVHGVPMTIETNYSNQPTKVVFPLKNVQLPNDPKARLALLESLAVFIEHSDGEKKVQKGKIVYDDEGNPEGIEIEISKFSTFTIISIELDDINELTAETNLTDINGHWAEKSIRELISKGAANGYPDGTFQPNKTVTRAEFTAMIVKALDITKIENEKTFSDIQNHWAKNVIELAASNGIVNGLNQGQFGPNERITREQMATIITNAGKLEAVESKSSFQDYNKIASWAVGSVNTAVHNKIMNGLPNKTFNPKGKATRAEAAAVIINLLNLNN